MFLASILINYFPYSSTTFFQKQDWLRINERIVTSKSKITGDTLYVGDSVAGQLLPFNRNNFLTSNGSVYPVGNYFLIKNSIEKNKNITNVIYLSVPDVIGNSLSRERTHPYFVKPFYTLQNRDEILSSDVINAKLKHNKFLDFNLFNGFKILSIDDYDYSDGSPQFSYSISDESIEWITRIDSLCKENNVKFQIASPPVPNSKRIESNNWQLMKTQISHTKIENLFEQYFDTIIYLDDKYLRDHIHWKREIIVKNRNEYINIIKARLN